MSKEFEEIVLKKLDLLDERTINTDKLMREIQLELKDTQEVVKYLNQSFTNSIMKLIEKLIRYLMPILLTKKRTGLMKKILFL